VFYQPAKQKKFYRDVVLNVDDAPTYVCIDLTGSALLGKVYAPHISLAYKCKFCTDALIRVMEFIGPVSFSCRLATYGRGWHWKVDGSIAFLELCHLLVNVIQSLCYADADMSSYSDDFHVTWN